MMWTDRKTYEEILKGKEVTVPLESKSVAPVLVTIKLKEEEN